jgi:hypothetical protein
MGLLVAAALTNLQVHTKRVHAETRDELHAKFKSWHAICSGMLKMRGRNVYSKPYVHSYT